MKFMILGVVLLILLGGGAFGAATMGFVDIPGISPQKFGKAVVASRNPAPGFLSNFALPLQSLGKKVKAETDSVKTPPPPQDIKAPKPNPDLGDEALAELWNQMDADSLTKITAKWPPNNLARVLLKMKPDLVGQLLAALPTDRGVQLSQAIQQFASLPTSAPVQ